MIAANSSVFIVKMRKLMIKQNMKTACKEKEPLLEVLVKGIEEIIIGKVSTL